MTLAPKTDEPRPILPENDANPYLSTLRDKKLDVKYQVVTREGQEIVVGRVKIPTPNGHRAFILRRFDTGAISLTTMFRAAFPSASEDAEKNEASWVKANFDSQGANGSTGNTALRLAGTWVTTDVALTLAEAYNLEHIVRPLAEANPDPGQEYRRSTKPDMATNTPVTKPATAPEPVVLPPTPTPTVPNPTKRRRGAREPSPLTSNPPQNDALAVSRRSTRATSPASVSSTNSRGGARNRKKPLSTRQSENEAPLVTPSHDEHNKKDETDPDYVQIGGPDMKADIEEQRAMISQLKAEREASGSSSTSTTAPKRVREGEDDSLKFNFAEGSKGAGEPAMEVERPIATNRRINLAPQQKSAAWGVLLFAAGLAAAATIPSLLM